jgi:hypothetical protein
LRSGDDQWYQSRRFESSREEPRQGNLPLVNLPADAAPRLCRNCESPLGGAYCSACGQAAHESARSLETLFHDAWNDLTSLDGRLWRTLGALAFRPGLLTSEYLRDRRAQYLPPFRLYLVLSLLFFALQAVAARASHRPAVTLETSGQGAVALDRACSSLATTGGERLGSALVAGCKNAMADGGRTLGHAFLENVPKTFFLFLPLVALVLFGLFGRARRYYVEHLVLVLHMQAAMFLLASFAVAVAAARRWGGLAETLENVAAAGLCGYGAWYAFRSLRTVYGEGRGATIAKFAVLGLAYVILLVVTLAGTVLVSLLYA